MSEGHRVGGGGGCWLGNIVNTFSFELFWMIGFKSLRRFVFAIRNQFVRRVRPPTTPFKMTRHVVGPLDLYTVRAFILVDSEGKRILAKYYQLPGTSGLTSQKEQRGFERGLWEKTRRLQG